jgi:hypothetical protein
MFCIAAFIILCFLGIFSARYRRLAGKAWYCVSRKLTLRTCEIRFDEELKGKLLGKLIITHPHVARWLSRWFDVLAFIFVVLSIWSLVVVLIAGLNLFVYGTCDPQNAEACSLSSETCSIASAQETFVQSVLDNHELTWAANQVTDLGEAIQRIPDRLKNWNVADYITTDNTYYAPYDAAKQTALEIIDPGCIYCAKLFANIETADFEHTHNLTYIAYPIPNPTKPGQYKFKNSYLIAEYLEAAKRIAPATASTTPPDWQVLKAVFTGKDANGAQLQDLFDGYYTTEQATAELHALLIAAGYSQSQLPALDKEASSAEVASALAAQKAVVEQQIHTVKIPTIIFGGQRYSQVLSPGSLH